MHARWCFVYMWYVTVRCATVGDAHMDLFNKHLYFSDGSPQQRGHPIYLCDVRIGIVFDSYLAHGNVYRAFLTKSFKVGDWVRHRAPAPAMSLAISTVASGRYIVFSVHIPKGVMVT